MKKNILLLVLILFVSIQCGGGESVVGDAETGAAQVNDDPTIYNPSGFSSYLDFNTEQKKLRMAYSFFPDGTRFDFKEKLVAIPCSFIQTVPEGVSASVNAPIETPCATPYELQFSEDGSEFTLNGIVVSIDEDYSKFASQFGFIIKTDGIYKSSNQERIVSDKGKLEDFYEIVTNN